MRLPLVDRAGRALLLALLATLPLANPYIRGEGNGHYAYVRSLVIDGDLDFENEYRRGDPDFVTSNFRRADGHLWPPLRTRAGRVRNQWPAGAALLWAPAFMQAHAAVLVLRAAGSEMPADGYALAYRLACAVATVAYAALGLLLAYRMAEKLAGTGPALLAAAGVWLASSLPAYMYFLPFYGHALGAFAVSLFLWPWIGRPLARARDWALWGAAAGLMVAVDHFALPMVSVAAVEWVRRALPGGRWDRVAARAAGVRALAFGAAAVAAALPELAAKWILHGSPLRSGRMTRFFWTDPQLWATGFSTQHGLFLWTPIALASVAGLVLLARARPAIGGPLLAGFAGCYYMVASYELWHGSSSFGNRFFVSLTPVFVIGLAALADRAGRTLARLRPAVRWAALFAPVAVLAAWNAGLMLQWATGMIPRQGPVDPRAVARNQVTAVPARIASVALRYLTARSEAVPQR